MSLGRLFYCLTVTIYGLFLSLLRALPTRQDSSLENLSIGTLTNELQAFLKVKARSAILFPRVSEKLTSAHCLKIGYFRCESCEWLPGLEK